MSETVSRPSRSPGPAAQKKSAARPVTRPASRRTSSQAARCNALVARCSQPLSEGARAFFVVALTDDAARRSGQRFTPRKLVAEWITVASTLAPWVLSGSVTGYGPVRFRYAAELAQQIAARAAQPIAEAPSAPAVVSAAPVDVAALERAVVQGLRNVGVQAKAAAVDASQPEVSRSLEALAQAVELAQRTVPAEVLADAGLTAAVIEALSSAADHALGAHTEALTTREAARSFARGEDVMLGRLAREIRTLLASARTAHAQKSSVPCPRSSLLAHPKRAPKPAKRDEDPPK